MSEIFEIHQMPLPAHCLPGRLLTSLDGAVIHYFSARNVDESRMFDPTVCYRLLLDLNRPKPEREQYMKGDLWPDDRCYASAHYLVARDGIVWQLAPSTVECYHAGASLWDGRPRLNQWTVGIELIGHQHSQFTREQYVALAQLLNELESTHGFPRDNVVGHDRVRHEAIRAGVKARPKYDPTGRHDGQGDNFDWFYLGKLWNDIKPNPAGVATVEQLDDLIDADPLSSN